MLSNEVQQISEEHNTCAKPCVKQSLWFIIMEGKANRRSSFFGGGSRRSYYSDKLLALEKQTKKNQTSLVQNSARNAASDDRRENTSIAIKQNIIVKVVVKS